MCHTVNFRFYLLNAKCLLVQFIHIVGAEQFWSHHEVQFLWFFSSCKKRMHMHIQLHIQQIMIVFLQTGSSIVFETIQFCEA